jgi:hypothetical protein
VPSNPSWTSSAVQVDQGTNSTNYSLVDAFASEVRRTKVRSQPYLCSCPDSPHGAGPSCLRPKTPEELAELFPCPESPEDPDPLCLHQACEGVMTDLYSNIQTYALQFLVPVDLLTDMVTDRLVSSHMGVEPTPAIYFIPEREES